MSAQAIWEWLGTLFGDAVDLRLVAAIIGILLGVRAAETAAAKKRGKRKALGKGAYVLMAMGGGLLAGAIKVGTSAHGIVAWLLAWVYSGILHAGAASMLYQVAKVVIPSSDQYWLKRPKA